MGSEWVELTPAEGGITGPVYVNLSNANSINPDGKGSAIWFLGDTGPEGRIYVTESPAKILELLEVRRAHRT
jgi:hypothetical protein